MMLEKKTTEFIDELSSSQPFPGGGGASAAVGAFASALGLMVANLTVGKKRYADVEEEIKEIREKLLKLQSDLIALTDKDAEAFEPVSKAYKLPKETKEQQEYKDKIMEAALWEASIVPLEIMVKIHEVMKLLKILGEKGTMMAISDIGVGILFGQAALEGASFNIFINTRSMKNRENAAYLEEKADAMIAEAEVLYREVYYGILAKIRS